MLSQFLSGSIEHLQRVRLSDNNSVGAELLRDRVLLETAFIAGHALHDHAHLAQEVDDVAETVPDQKYPSSGSVRSRLLLHPLIGLAHAGVIR